MPNSLTMSAGRAHSGWASPLGCERMCSLIMNLSYAGKALFLYGHARARNLQGCKGLHK
jgi:hypothetical protein